MPLCGEKWEMGIRECFTCSVRFRCRCVFEISSARIVCFNVIIRVSDGKVSLFVYATVLYSTNFPMSHRKVGRSYFHRS